MELALNLGWVVLSTVMCWLWMHHPARCKGRGRSEQFVSLMLVLVILFAVVTMYDDMAMAQNPAEARSVLREDDLGAHTHAVQHPVANFTQPLFPEPSFEPFYLGVVGNRPAPTLQSPAMGSIRNRPPPAA